MTKKGDKFCRIVEKKPEFVDNFFELYLFSADGRL